MKWRFLTLMVALFWLSVGCDQVQSMDQVTDIDKTEAQSLLAKGGVTVLDLRTASEFEGGHVEGAILVDFYGADFRNKLAALEKEKPYLIYCASGGRSKQSLRLFNQLGFKQIYHLYQGAAGGLP